MITFDDVHVGDVGKTNHQASGRAGLGRGILDPDWPCCIVFLPPRLLFLHSSSFLCLSSPSMLPLIIRVEACNFLGLLLWKISNTHKWEQNKEATCTHYSVLAVSNIMSVMVHFSLHAPPPQPGVVEANLGYYGVLNISLALICKNYVHVM